MLPHIQRLKNKNRRKKLLQKVIVEQAQTVADTPVSKTLQKKLDHARRQEIKKAEHKLSFFDRLFGFGKGPVRLRMKWMNKLFGKNN
jgi:hypothetical protein